MAASVSRDRFGVTRVDLDTADSNNTPGWVEVDSDVFSSGPVAFLRVQFAAENVGETEREVSFGPFVLTFPSDVEGATVRGTCLLGQAEARAIAAALLEAVGPQEEDNNVERYANGLEIPPELRRAALPGDDPYQTGDGTKPCPDCGGQGMVNRSHDPQTAENCPTCGGEGSVDADYEEEDA